MRKPADGRRRTADETAPPSARPIPFTDHLAPMLDGCPRCGGVGCKACGERRLLLESLGYAPDDEIDPGDGDPEDGDVDDGADAMRRRREREDESFARRLARGMAMRAAADDSVLDD